MIDIKIWYADHKKVLQTYTFCKFTIGLKEVRQNEYEVNYWDDSRFLKSYNFTDLDKARDCYSYISNVIRDVLYET